MKTVNWKILPVKATNSCFIWGIYSIYEH